MGKWMGVTGSVAINLTFLLSEMGETDKLNYIKVHKSKKKNAVIYLFSIQLLKQLGLQWLFHVLF